MTGIPNRRQLFEDIPVINSIETGYIGLFMADVDHFKEYNDTYGHQKGDDCLSAVGECLAKLAEDKNVQVYRFGGEEFVGIVHGDDEQVIHRTCETLRLQVEAMQMPHEKNNGGVVTISIGYTISAPGTPRTYDDLLQRADRAVYAAKANGRNQTVCI